MEKVLTPTQVVLRSRWLGDGKLNGYAIKYNADGSIYREGMFKNDEFLDAQEKPENSLTAEIASDLPPCPSSGYFHNCFGTWNDGTGYKYVGEWKNNEQHGQGTSTWSAPLSNAGEKYVGEWKNHKQNGQGTSTYSMPHSSAGYKYVGEFRDGKKHGQGTSTWSEPSSYAGEIYVGEFRNDKIHGQGNYTVMQMAINIFGEYRDGNYSDKAIYTFAESGNKYVGEFRDGNSTDKAPLFMVQNHGQAINMLVNIKITKGTDKVSTFTQMER